jgi:hypothetical protein
MILVQPLKASNHIHLNLIIGNSGNSGGAFKVTASKLYLNYSEFYKNYALEGGAIFMDNSGFASLSNVKASRNYALVSGGVIQAVTGSYFELLDSTLSNNYAD